jgi:hypothetical protein
VVAGARPLLETDALHTPGGFGGNISEQTLSSLRGLRGIQVSSAQEPMFDSAEVQLEYLLGWAGCSPASALGAALAGDDR